MPTQEARSLSFKLAVGLTSAHVTTSNEEPRRDMIPDTPASCYLMSGSACRSDSLMEGGALALQQHPCHHHKTKTWAVRMRDSRRVRATSICNSIVKPLQFQLLH